MVATPNRAVRKTRARISKSGQVTLPARIRQKLGVDVGEVVEFIEQQDGTITVKPVRFLSVEEISGKFGRSIDPKELQEDLREAREVGMVRQRYRDGSITNDLD